jgi:hypothetical protein
MRFKRIPLKVKQTATKKLANFMEIVKVFLKEYISPKFPMVPEIGSLECEQSKRQKMTCTKGVPACLLVSSEALCPSFLVVYLSVPLSSIPVLQESRTHH